MAYPGLSMRKPVKLAAIGLGVAALTFSAGVAALQPGSAQRAFSSARANLANAAAALGRQARPASHAALARLHLPRERVAAISTGRLDGRLVARTAGNGFICGATSCVCFGDDDCNNMYSTVCRNPSTGGSCNTTTPFTICTCNYRS